MPSEHTLDQLRSLRLDGMVRAIEDQTTSTAATALGFDERLALLVQREIAWRDDRRVARLMKAARLKVSTACVENINWRASRSLDRAQVAALAGGDWLRHAQNLLITGATGCGKTWLACALAHQAARSGFSVLYTRAARLFDELQVAHGDGSFIRRLAALARLDLLVIDDFAISPMGAPERNDLLEVLDDRVGTRSTLAHDAAVAEQSLDITFAQARDTPVVEAQEGCPEVLSLDQNGAPAQARLETFQAQLLEEAVVIRDREAPFSIVIMEKLGSGGAPATARLPIGPEESRAHFRYVPPGTSGVRRPCWALSPRSRP